MTAKPNSRKRKIPARIRHKRVLQHAEGIEAAIVRCLARGGAYDAIKSPSGPELADRWYRAYNRLVDFKK